MVSESILVTGANGFIGRRLVSKLAQCGHKITAFVKNPQFSDLEENPQIDILVGDITNPADVALAVRESKKVYHLASVVDYWQRDPQRFIEVNVQGTENLLAAARNAGVERVLICSSCGIFGPSPDGKMIDETTSVNLDKLGSYEQSKFLQRKLALQYNSRSLPTVIAYPTRVFGPTCVSGTSALTQMLQKAVRQRRCFVPGNGHNVGNYVFVDDVVKGLILVMDKAFAGEEFIIGGTNLTYVQLIQHLERAAHRSISIWRIPKPVFMMVAYLELLRSILFRTRPGITVQAVDKYAADWPVSIAKAKRELGYEPLEIESALESTLDEDWLA